jgi:hypothetical protein
MARHVFMNMSVLHFAVDCLKSPATSGPVQRLMFRPSSIFAVEITEFHINPAPYIILAIYAAIMV